MARTCGPSVVAAVEGSVPLGGIEQRAADGKLEGGVGAVGCGVDDGELALISAGSLGRECDVYSLTGLGRYSGLVDACAEAIGQCDRLDSQRCGTPVVDLKVLHQSELIAHAEGDGSLAAVRLTA